MVSTWKLHREDGRAIEYVDGRSYWYKNEVGQITNHYKVKDWDLFKFQKHKNLCFHLMITKLKTL